MTPIRMCITLVSLPANELLCGSQERGFEPRFLLEGRVTDKDDKGHVRALWAELAPLLSLVPRVVSLTQRAVAAAREGAGIDDALHTDSALRSDVKKRAVEVGKALLDNDELLAKAVLELGSLSRRAADNPLLAKTMQTGTTLALDAADKVIAKAVDAAIAGTSQRHHAEVAEALFAYFIDKVADRIAQDRG